MNPHLYHTSVAAVYDCRVLRTAGWMRAIGDHPELDLQVRLELRVTGSELFEEK